MDQPCSYLNAFIPNLEWRHPESRSIHFKDVILSPALFSRGEGSGVDYFELNPFRLSALLRCLKTAETLNRRARKEDRRGR